MGRFGGAKFNKAAATAAAAAAVADSPDELNLPEGMPAVSVIDPEVRAALSKPEKKVLHLVNEMYTSELVFYRNLGKCVAPP